VAARAARASASPFRSGIPLVQRMDTLCLSLTHTRKHTHAQTEPNARSSKLTITGQQVAGSGRYILEPNVSLSQSECANRSPRTINHGSRRRCCGRGREGLGQAGPAAAPASAGVWMRGFRGHCGNKWPQRQRPSFENCVLHQRKLGC
jgi:hypothetical protein